MEKRSVGFFRPFFPASLPYGIAYLMAMLRKENLPFDFFDEQVHLLTEQQINKISGNYDKPLAFCISFLTEATHRALSITNWIKNHYPDSVTILGGIHVTALPEEILANTSVDYVFTGEAENAIIDIYNKILNKKSLADIKGIGYRKNEKNIINERCPVINDLDDIPIIPYEIFAPYKKYDLGYITSSRGCPYNCIFCNNNLTGSRKCRYNSTNKTIEELDLLINKYNQTDITFFDDNFLSEHQRVYELCEHIEKKELNKKAQFMFQTRAKDVDPEIMKRLFTVGFKTVFFGIETVSEHLLRTIGKNENPGQIASAVALAKKTGYKVIANYLYCLPGETTEDRKECLRFSIQNNIDVVKFNNVVPYPGTRLFNTYNTTPFIRTMRDYRNYNSQLILITPFWRKIIFPFIPAKNTKQMIIHDTWSSYLKFYFRAKILKSIVRDKKWGGILFRMGNDTKEVIYNIPGAILLFFDLVIKIFGVLLKCFTRGFYKKQIETNKQVY
ncbi:MAG TPA: radical SAM protein [Bacteroidales bacterium]|nr:radical SAM protein [Bacteroidales bacterium]